MFINSGVQTQVQNSSSSEETPQVDYIQVSRPSTKNSEIDPKM